VFYCILSTSEVIGKEFIFNGPYWMFKFPIIVIFHFSIDLHVIKSDVGQISVSFIFTHVFFCRRIKIYWTVGPDRFKSLWSVMFFYPNCLSKIWRPFFCLSVHKWSLKWNIEQQHVQFWIGFHVFSSPCLELLSVIRL